MGLGNMGLGHQPVVLPWLKVVAVLLSTPKWPKWRKWRQNGQNGLLRHVGVKSPFMAHTSRLLRTAHPHACV